MEVQKYFFGINGLRRSGSHPNRSLSESVNRPENLYKFNIMQRHPPPGGQEDHHEGGRCLPGELQAHHRDVEGGAGLPVVSKVGVPGGSC